MSKSVLSLEELIQYQASIADNSSAAEFMNQKMISTTLYIAGIGDQLIGLGQMIDGNTKPKVGITNFPSANVLPAGVNALVTEARMLFGTVTAGQTPVSSDWKATAPKEWLNADLTFTQGGISFSTPISDLHNFKASTGNDDDFRSIIPFKIREQVAFNFVTELAGTSASTVAWRLELRAVLYTDKAAVK